MILSMFRLVRKQFKIFNSFAIVIIACILVMSSAYYAFCSEQLAGFDTKVDLPILNEALRKIDRALLYGRLRTSATDSSLGYLNTEILNITVIGSVTNGNIAGWTISATSLSSGTGATTVGLDSGGTNPAIYCGSATPASAPFRVTNGGAMTATSGSIGGWTLASDRLSYGTDADYIGLIPGTGIQLGDSTFADAEFSVTNAGALTCTTGTVKGLLTVGTAGTTIQIDGANNRIRTSDYVSGAFGSGWNIDNTWAEFNNIRARGRISTAVFEKLSISSVGGNFLVCDSDTLAADMTAADSSVFTITGNSTFAVNDILRIKSLTDTGSDDEWFVVTNTLSAPTYTVTRDAASTYTANANPAWKKGTCVVNYGASGEGLIYMTASDTNSPHIDVLTHAGAPWSTTTTRMRIGNVNGFLGAATDLYGIYIGETNAYLKYDPTNGLQVKGTITCVAGSDVDTGLTSAITNCLFTDSTTKTNIEAWKSADVTLIDGGKIYTNSITVSKLGTNIFGIGQLIDNGNFEDWSAGTTVAPDSWTLVGSNATVASDTMSKLGTYSAKMTRVGTDCYLLQSVGTEKGIAYWKGRTVTFGCWVYATVASRVRVGTGDAVANSYSAYHTGNSTWQYLTVTRTIDSNATDVYVLIFLTDGNTSVYMDGAMFVEGSYAMPYADKSRNWGHPSDYTKIDGGDIYTGTVTADKITAGTFIGGNFVIGNGGAFQSDNYVADTAGVRLNHEGLEINQGATVMGEGILETIMIYGMLFGGN